MISVYLALLTGEWEEGYFRKLYTRYETELYQIALSALSDTSLAEDAVGGIAGGLGYSGSARAGDGTGHGCGAHRHDASAVPGNPGAEVRIRRDPCCTFAASCSQSKLRPHCM